MTTNLISDLSKLNQHGWNVLVRNIAFENKTYPKTDFLGNDVTSTLLNLYRTINKEKKSLLIFLNKAIVYNLLTIEKSRSNTFVIYSFIYYLHEIKPIELKYEVVKILKNNNLGNLHYGSSNLNELLLKSLILLEDTNNVELLEHISALPFSNNYIYLKLLFYNRIGKIDLALSEINKILSGNIILKEKEKFIFYNGLIDTIPNYMDLTKLIYNVHSKKVSIPRDKELVNQLNNAINFWSINLKYNSRYIEMLLLHFNDYVNKVETNANLYPYLIDIISENDDKLGMLISNYYANMDYNIRYSNNSVEFSNNLLASY